MPKNGKGGKGGKGTTTGNGVSKTRPGSKSRAKGKK
jgi:hypothetical protein